MLPRGSGQTGSPSLRQTTIPDVRSDCSSGRRRHQNSALLAPTGGHFRNVLIPTCQVSALDAQFLYSYAPDKEMSRHVAKSSIVRDSAEPEKREWKSIPPVTWTSSEVVQWMRWLGLPHAVQEAFICYPIDGKLLLDVAADESLLFDFGVESVFTRKALSAALTSATSIGPGEVWPISDSSHAVDYWSHRQVLDYCAQSVDKGYLRGFADAHIIGAQLRSLSCQDLEDLLPSQVLPHKRLLRCLMPICPSASTLWKRLFSSSIGKKSLSSTSETIAMLTRSQVQRIAPTQPAVASSVSPRHVRSAVYSGKTYVNVGESDATQPELIGMGLSGSLGHFPFTRAIPEADGLPDPQLTSLWASPQNVLVEAIEVVQFSPHQNDSMQSDLAHSSVQLMIGGRYAVPSPSPKIVSELERQGRVIVDAIDTLSRKRDKVKLKIFTSGAFTHAMREISTLDTLGTTCCVEVLHDLIMERQESLCSQGSICCLVLQWSGQNMSQLAQHSELSVNDIRSIMEKVALCLKGVHDRGYVHTALILENIVEVSGDRTIRPKLCNLEYAMQEGASGFDKVEELRAFVTMFPDCCLPEWIPLLTRIEGGSLANISLPVGYSLDVWAFGVCLLRMFNGGRLIPELSSINSLQNLSQRISSCERPLIQTEGVLDAQARQLIDFCLHAQPELRPSISQILTHPFFGVTSRSAILQPSPTITASVPSEGAVHQSLGSSQHPPTPSNEGLSVKYRQPILAAELAATASSDTCLAEPLSSDCSILTTLPWITAGKAFDQPVYEYRDFIEELDMTLSHPYFQHSQYSLRSTDITKAGDAEAVAFVTDVWCRRNGLNGRQLTVKHVLVAEGRYSFRRANDIVLATSVANPAEVVGFLQTNVDEATGEAFISVLTKEPNGELFRFLHICGAMLMRRKRRLIPPTRPITVSCAVAPDATEQMSGIESLGYKLLFTAITLTIDLQSLPDATDSDSSPQLPDGFALRPYDKEEHSLALYKANIGAFSRSRKRPFVSYQKWREHMHDRTTGKTSDYMVCWHGDEIAAALFYYHVGFWEAAGEGKVSIFSIFTVEKYRNRGVATSLLQLAFQRLKEEGKISVMLTVERANKTGAVSLFKKVGMQAEHELYSYELELCPATMS